MIPITSGCRNVRSRGLWPGVVYEHCAVLSLENEHRARRRSDNSDGPLELRDVVHRRCSAQHRQRAPHTAANESRQLDVIAGHGAVSVNRVDDDLSHPTTLRGLTELHETALDL